MKNNGLNELVLEWAQQHGKPFTTSEAYDGMQDVDNKDALSNALGVLYRSGQIARMKIDKVRFSYALPEFAPNGLSITIQSGESL
jgi:hypothetical protein